EVTLPVCRAGRIVGDHRLPGTCVGGNSNGEICSADSDCAPPLLAACEPLPQEEARCSEGVCVVPNTGIPCQQDRDCGPVRTAIWTSSDGSACEASKCTSGGFQGSFCLTDADCCPPDTECPAGMCPGPKSVDLASCLPRFPDADGGTLFCRESAAKSCS